MTIAICLKVGDGVVLGADSASTLMGSLGVVNVYFNAEKIFNLRKGLPIGACTYGLGGLAGRSVTSLARDLRGRFTASGEWHLDEKNYTMEWVANHMRRFFYEELYCAEYHQPTNGPSVVSPGEEADTEVEAAQLPAMGFIITGFSAGAEHPETWGVTVQVDGTCGEPELIQPQVGGGVVWNGDPEAIQRLMHGFSGDAVARLMQAGLPEDQAVALLSSPAGLVNTGMPVQDAIDLVDYLAAVTVGYVRFRPGAPTVAPPIDLAAITRHEGFRWVKRKHYYSSDLNPPLSRDHVDQ